MSRMTRATTLHSLATLKTWIKLAGVETTDDDRLAIAADGATAEIEQEIGVYFVQRPVTEVFSGHGKCQYALGYAPAVITAFTMDGSPVDPSTYYLDPATGIITFTSGSFNWGIKNITITYTAGYDVQDGPLLPADVLRAAVDLTKAIYDELSAGAIAATSVSLGASTMVIKAAKRPPSVQRVIDSFEGQGMRA